MGDRILKVNEEDVTKMTHQDAVLTLLKPTEEITLTVQHDPLPENFQVIIKVILNVIYIMRNVSTSTFFQDVKIKKNYIS